MSELNVMGLLRDGVLRFQAEVYQKNADEYRRAAATPQRPHSLIIACADSRVDVETVTSSGPGQLFITRNVGSMVPAYGEMMGGVSAVLEYAVAALGVGHVAVWGHSDCGAMKALLNPAATAALPTVQRWLLNGHAALGVTDSLCRPEEPMKERLRRLTEENVLMQVAHLKTHPSVAAAMARRDLTVSGWVYEIGTGEVRIAADPSREFVPVTA